MPNNSTPVINEYVQAIFIISSQDQHILEKRKMWAHIIYQKHSL